MSDNSVIGLLPTVPPVKYLAKAPICSLSPNVLSINKFLARLVRSLVIANLVALPIGLLRYALPLTSYASVRRSKFRFFLDCAI